MKGFARERIDNKVIKLVTNTTSGLSHAAMNHHKLRAQRPRQTQYGLRIPESKNQKTCNVKQQLQVKKQYMAQLGIFCATLCLAANCDAPMDI